MNKRWLIRSCRLLLSGYVMKRGNEVVRRAKSGIKVKNDEDNGYFKLYCEVFVSLIFMYRLTCHYICHTTLNEGVVVILFLIACIS